MFCNGMSSPDLCDFQMFVSGCHCLTCMTFYVFYYGMTMPYVYDILGVFKGMPLSGLYDMSLPDLYNILKVL